MPNWKPLGADVASDPLDGAPEVKDLGVLIGEMLFLYRKKLHERGITVRQDLAPGTHARVVMGGFKQVFSNILSNAIDACSANGEIAIELRRDTDYVLLAVTDNGSGIKPENLSHIFEPFFTTKKDVGTGLGLWISKQIIERHGGTIAIESASVQPCKLCDGNTPSSLRHRVHTCTLHRKRHSVFERTADSIDDTTFRVKPWSEPGTLSMLALFVLSLELGVDVSKHRHSATIRGD